MRERDIVDACDTHWRFLRCEEISSIKAVFASEQSRPNDALRRARWKRYQAKIDPARIVVIDEAWGKTNMTRTHGWWRRGARFRARVPHGHWRTMTFLAALRIDNLGSHKGGAVRSAIRAAGAKLLSLLPYSPDLNPIEQVFAKLKTGRQFAAWPGLVPQQHSSGGKERLGSISKRGDGYIRRLPIHGARAIVGWRKRSASKVDRWISGLLNRGPVNVATVALANKSARIAWALMSGGTDYDHRRCRAA